MKVAIIGATGNLGLELIQAFAKAKHQVTVLVRSTDKLIPYKNKIKSIRPVDFSEPETLKSELKGIDIVVSALGITRQNDGKSFMDVDFQANKNVLDEANKAGVKKFIYTSVINIDKLKDVEVLEAKRKFEKTLQKSPIKSLIIRPTGFFSDLLEVYKMAKYGRVYTVADPKTPFTPISPKDLAQYIVENIEKEGVFDIGGPEKLSFEKITKTCSKVLKKDVKITQISDGFTNFIHKAVGLFSGRISGLISFFRAQAQLGDNAPQYGSLKFEKFLKDYVKANEKISKQSKALSFLEKTEKKLSPIAQKAKVAIKENSVKAKAGFEKIKNEASNKAQKLKTDIKKKQPLLNEKLSQTKSFVEKTKEKVREQFHQTPKQPTK